MFEKCSLRYFWIFLYLEVVGAIAINIHIQLQKHGVPYPELAWETQVPWAKPLMYVLQSIAVLWLTHRIMKWKPKSTTSDLFFMVSVTLIATQELMFRLPCTDGYVTDGKVLYVWFAHTYFAKILLALLLTAFIVNIRGQNMLNQIGLVVIFSFLIYQYVYPTFLSGSVSLSTMLPNQPDAAGIIPDGAYPWQVTAVASVTYIEPMLAAFFVCYVISTGVRKSLFDLILQTMPTLMVLNKIIFKFAIVCMYGTVTPFKTRFMSVAQFALETVFVGIAVPPLVFYLQKHETTKKAA